MWVCLYLCVWLFSHSLRSLVQGTIKEPVEYYQKVEGNAGVWGKAVATIDASAARVFADCWCLDSYEFGKDYVKESGPDALREIIRIPNTHSILVVNLLRFPSPVSNRVFATWFSWRKEPDDSFLVAFGPLEDYGDEAKDAVKLFMATQKGRREREGDTREILLKDNEDLELMIQQQDDRMERVEMLSDLIQQHPLASKAIRATVRGYWRIKPLATSVCQLTYLVQAELGGSIPSALMITRIRDTLGTVQTMQVKFARNGKLVDKEMRDVFASPPPLAELSEEQMSVVEDCRSLESEDGREWETLASPSPFVTMWMKYAAAKENERSIAIGKATAVIDCPMHEAVGESSKACARRAARLASERATGAIEY